MLDLSATINASFVVTTVRHPMCMGIPSLPGMNYHTEVGFKEVEQYATEEEATNGHKKHCRLLLESEMLDNPDYWPEPGD